MPVAEDGRRVQLCRVQGPRRQARRRPSGPASARRVGNGLLRHERPCGPPSRTSRDLWRKGLENLVKWSWYAQHFLDATVYNAAKHGLAVQPGEAAFQLGDDELISRSGPAIEYLEVRDEYGRRRWHRTTQWVDVGHSLAYVFVACRLMKGLMDVARARYTDQPLRGLDLFVEPRFENTLTGEGIEFTKLSFGLLYYRTTAIQTSPRSRREREVGTRRGATALRDEGHPAPSVLPPAEAFAEGIGPSTTASTRAAGQWDGTPERLRAKRGISDPERRRRSRPSPTPLEPAGSIAEARDRAGSSNGRQARAVRRRGAPRCSRPICGPRKTDHPPRLARSGARKLARRRVASSPGVHRLRSRAPPLTRWAAGVARRPPSPAVSSGTRTTKRMTRERTDVAHAFIAS